MAERTLKILVRILLMGLMTVGFSSCAVRNLALDQMVGVIETGLPAFEQESDLDLLEKAFPANIKLLETLLVSRPANDRLLVLLSRMVAGYAFSFFEERLDAVVLSGNVAGGGPETREALRAALNRYYLKGADYALRALEVRHPGCREKLSKVAAVRPFLDSLTTKDVPALFWYGFNLGAWVNQNRDSMRAVAKAFVAEKAMLRVLELDGAYYHGSAHLFLMIYYASRPPMMGGKPEKALAHYRQLKALAGDDFLPADVYYARYYLHRIQNRQEYEAVLTRVLNHRTTGDVTPFLNAVAVKRAKIYLNAADQLFE